MDGTARKRNLDEMFSRITEQWSPHLAGEVNGMHVKLVKLKGEFVWHHHDHEDELFLVHRGEFTMRFRDHDEEIRKGEFIVVPRGVEHCPVAETECELLLFEPASTRNTGNVTDHRTREELPTIR